MNWNEEMTAAYVAGKDGKACPNDMAECYRQGLRESGRDAQLCFYVPGNRTIIDTINAATGLGHCGGRDLESAQAEYPGAMIYSLDLAIEGIEAANNACYKPGTMTETTKERFWEMLEVLPPVDWHRGHGCEAFKMSELTCGNITSCFARVGSRYYEGYARTSDRSETVIRWAILQRNADHPEECTADMQAAKV